MIESFKVSPKLPVLFLSLFPIFNKYAHCCNRIAQWELYSGWWSINPNLLWRYNSAASQEYKWNRWKGKNQDFFIGTSSIFKEIHMNKNKNLMGIILVNVDNHNHLEVNRNTLYNFLTLSSRCLRSCYLPCKIQVEFFLSLAMYEIWQAQFQ